MSYTEEVQRIRRVYEQRERRELQGPRLLFDSYALCVIQEREELLLHLLSRRGLSTLAAKNILDLGCGNGALLRHLLDFGADPRRCVGVDILPGRLQTAQRLSPNMTFLCANGAELPFAGEGFDLVFQFTVFTSVLDAALRKAMAYEISRVLRRGGLFVWYDFFLDNPRNPFVRGIAKPEIRSLLPGFRLTFHRTTLAPPAGRAVTRLSSFFYRSLSSLRLLCTHYLCIGEKL